MTFTSKYKKIYFSQFSPNFTRFRTEKIMSLTCKWLNFLWNRLLTDFGDGEFIFNPSWINFLWQQLWVTVLIYYQFLNKYRLILNQITILILKIFLFYLLELTKNF